MQPSFEVNVPLTESKTYPIYIGSGILNNVTQLIPQKYAAYKRFLITDKNVESAGHSRKLQPDVPDGYVIDPPGEESKRLETVERILNKLDEREFGRDTMIIALGGGTVGDVAGFAASLFKRGVPVLQVPTTTVAQADSAIGGKTGVNSEWSKNAFGTFWNPCMILIDIATLQTLDERHYIAGLAESVKHAFIADASYAEYIEGHEETIRKRNAETLIELARRNSKIKGGVVAVDPYERTGHRCVLNFGHTLGHAIEGASNYSILHGEAIAIGMIIAAKLGVSMNITAREMPERIERLLNGLGLPVKLPPNISSDDLIEIMKKDKKTVSDQIRFILLSDTGTVYAPRNEYTHPVDLTLLKRTCESLP